VRKKALLPEAPCTAGVGDLVPGAKPCCSSVFSELTTDTAVHGRLARTKTRLEMPRHLMRRLVAAAEKIKGNGGFRVQRGPRHLKAMPTTVT